MPGPDPFLGFVEDSFWTCNEHVPRFADKVAANKNSHNRPTKDFPQERSVELLDLELTGQGLCELALEENDSMWLDEVGVRLGIAEAVGISKAEPLTEDHPRPQSTPELFPHTPLISKPLTLRPLAASALWPRCLR